MGKRPFQKTILYLLDGRHKYLTVKNIIEEMSLDDTLAIRVSIRRSINSLSAKGKIYSGHIRGFGSNRWILCCWLPSTPNLSINRPIKTSDLEIVILNLLQYVESEFGSDRAIEYNMLLKCVRGMHSKINVEDKNDPRLPVSYHRALKALQTRKSIEFIMNEDNNRIARILLR